MKSGIFIKKMGLLIHANRILKGVCQGTLAKKLKMHQQKLHRMETGKAKISAYDIARIAKILNLPLSSFVQKTAIKNG